MFKNILRGLIFSHFLNVDNAGDLYSCPFDYFQSEFKFANKVNFLNLKHYHINQNLILGGGGMLHNGFIKEIEEINIKRGGKLIFWGAGINEHDINKQYFPTYLNKFDMVGLRDHKNPWDYVPCASCMNAGFDKKTPPITDFVVYEHYDINIPIQTIYKRNNRLNKAENLDSIISFLCQGTAIITNSFHGAYWGMLLGRKVIIYEPFSNRFSGFKYPVTFCNRDDWRGKLIGCGANLGYLQECRDLNVRFCEKVVDLMS